MLKPGDFVMVNCPEYRLAKSPFPAVIDRPDTTHGYDWRVRCVYIHTDKVTYHIDDREKQESDILPFYAHELTPWDNTLTFRSNPF